MKTLLHLILLISFYLLEGPYQQLMAQPGKTLSWSAKFGYQKAFIENKGQFTISDRFGNTSPVLFAVDQGGTKIFFTKKGITYTLLEVFKKQKNIREAERERREEFNLSPEEFARHEKEEHQLRTRADKVSMLWQNANDHVQIEASDLTSDYHNYSFHDEFGTIKNLSHIHSYKKITYKNLYPNIDVEYVFAEKGGLKYSLILHPGADPSQVKMLYDANVSLNNNGEIHIKTSFGDIIDHAPLSFYQQQSSSIITSSFVKSGKTVSFQLSNYDANKTVIIDPWTQLPGFTSNWDCVWECEKDGSGNVYLIGGVTPMQLLKYNSMGALQWTYNTPYDTTAWLGTFAVDNAGNSYVTLGSEAKIEKISTAGTLIWSNGTPNGAYSLTEFWSIAFNCDQTKMIIGGTGGATPPPLPYVYEMDMTAGTIVSSVQVTSATLFPTQEIRSITSCGNGKYYFLTHDSIGDIHQNFSSCLSPQAGIYKSTNTYSLSYKCENFRYDNTGIAAIKANGSFVFVNRGNRLDKRDINSTIIIDSIAIPGGGFVNGAVQNSGIDIDDCGNIYVGSTNAVYKFDSNLNQLASYPTSYNVYDLTINTDGNVIICGSTGSSTTSIRTGFIEAASMSSCGLMTQTCCDASICSLNHICISDPAVTLQASNAGGTWSGNGITNVSTGVFDPSIAGIGSHTIKYSLPCGIDSINILVGSCGTVSVCTSSASLTAFGGDGPYKWSSTITTTNCSSCPGGNCLPPLCSGIAAPLWTATGTIVTAPSSTVFPIIVTDLASAKTFTFTTLVSLPICGTTKINEQDLTNNNISIYPNPNTGEFNIDYTFTNNGQELVLFDVLGKELKQFLLENNKGTKNIHVSDLSNGVYLYKIQNKTKVLFIGKLSINR
ncbi:MAG: T9SS type A sorting domain-containing protein [Bacteroidetes bacterium]|nr:T9SS type A sorting domain-containing protein [Bacteroidota bacterium]